MVTLNRSCLYNKLLSLIASVNCKEFDGGLYLSARAKSTMPVANITLYSRYDSFVQNFQVDYVMSVVFLTYSNSPLASSEAGFFKINQSDGLHFSICFSGKRLPSRSTSCCRCFRPSKDRWVGDSELETILPAKGCRAVFRWPDLPTDYFLMHTLNITEKKSSNRQ